MTDLWKVFLTVAAVCGSFSLVCLAFSVAEINRKLDELIKRKDSDPE